jgi:uncharacterized protein
VLDEHTLAFADNRQYISLGNLSENPKAFLFLMDYANSQRVKVGLHCGAYRRPIRL